MIGASKQLKDLIGNRAHGDSAKSMLFLRNYAMERFWSGFLHLSIETVLF